jgi:hypothetical protein
MGTMANVASTLRMDRLTGAIEEALHVALAVDPAKTKADIDALRAHYPTRTSSSLAATVFQRAAWKAMASGVATGLPTNLWVMVPAAVADVGVVLRTEVAAAARVAVIFDPLFFDDRDAAWELIVPILGLNAASQALRQLGVAAGEQLSRGLIRRCLAKEGLQNAILKVFGRRVVERTLIAKTVPVVGGVIGGAWNWVEVKLLASRVITYFEQSDAQHPVTH